MSAALDDAQAIMGDVRESLTTAIEAVNCAESCETMRDLRANVKEGMEALREALSALEQL